MSMTETVDDLVQVKSSPLQGRPIFDFEKPFAPVIEYPSPMAVQSKSALSAPDRLLFRLNRLFKPTKDLGSVLTTFNYSLYVLAYLDAKAHKLKSKAQSLITSKTTVTAYTESLADPDASSFAKLGSVVADTRATLRLFGLLPLYVRARRLISDSKNMDQVLHFIALLQVSFFATFQLLENVAFLKHKNVLSHGGLLGRWTGRPAALFKIAHRAWFLGILCEFARLMREAQLFFRKSQIDKVELTEEEAERASQWYSDWIQPLAWLPISWQLSAWKNDDAPGFNLGVQGIAGVLADLRRTVSLWHATKANNS